MINFDAEELLKIAELSALKLDEKEVQAFANQLKNLLEYFQQIQNASDIEIEEQQRVMNVFREDKVISTDSAPLLAQAPEVEGDYFVVPKILE